MLNTSRQVAIFDPMSSFGTVLAMAYHATIAALQADEVDDDALRGTDGEDPAPASDGPGEPGRSSYLSALLIVAVLMFAWAGLRSL